MGPVQLLQLFSICTIGLFISLALAQRIALGMLIICIAFISDVLLGLTPIALVGGTNVYAPDVCFGLVMMAAVIRVPQLRRWTLVHVLWVAFGLCIFFSWWRGFEIFGLNGATNSLRNFFYLWSGAAYLSTFDLTANSLDRIYRFWTGASLVLLLIILSRFFFPIYSIDLSLSSAREMGVEVEDVLEAGFASGNDWLRLRVVGTNAAFLLSQTALLAAITAFRGRRPDALAWLLPVWLALVLILQHRTVWTTFLICAALLLPTLRIRAPLFLAVVGGLAILSLALLARLAAGTGDSMIWTSLGGAVNEISEVPQSTWFYRVQLWSQYFDRFLLGTLAEYVFGQPFGTTVYSTISVGNNMVTAEIFPHNFYVYSAFYLGIGGLALLVTAYALLIVRLWRHRSGSAQSITERDWAVLLIGHVVYFVTYGLSCEQSIVIGAAMSLAASSRRVVPRPVPAFGRAAGRPAF